MNSNLAFHFDYTDYAVKMGTEGDIFQTILDDYEKLGLVGEETNKLMAYLAATSRLMEKPLNILVIRYLIRRHNDRMKLAEMAMEKGIL